MRKLGLYWVAAALILSAPVARATIFGSIRGIVHDAQHRPIADAAVTLKSATSAWSATARTDAEGEFKFNAVPLGDYRVTVSQSGFDTLEETVTVISDSAPILHFPMKLATVHETATVSAQAEMANVDSVTPTTLLDRGDIEQTPGADRTNSLQMITDTVPGAY